MYSKETQTIVVILVILTAPISIPFLAIAFFKEWLLTRKEQKYIGREVGVKKYWNNDTQYIAISKISKLSIHDNAKCFQWKNGKQWDATLENGMRVSLGIDGDLLPMQKRI